MCSSVSPLETRLRYLSISADNFLLVFITIAYFAAVYRFECTGVSGVGVKD